MRKCIALQPPLRGGLEDFQVRTWLHGAESSHLQRLQCRFA
jgi:hypothetical protein